MGLLHSGIQISGTANFWYMLFFMVEDERAKGKPFDDSLNSVIKNFTPACVPLATVSHMAKDEDDDSGNYIASTGKDVASHMH